MNDLKSLKKTDRVKVSNVYDASHHNLTQSSGQAPDNTVLIY